MLERFRTIADVIDFKLFVMIVAVMFISEIVKTGGILRGNDSGDEDEKD